MSRTEIVLEYISSGIGSADTYMPIKAAPAMEMYVMWKDSVFTNPKMSQFYEDQYDRMVLELRTLEEPSMDELADVFYKTNSPLPKR